MFKKKQGKILPVLNKNDLTISCLAVGIHKVPMRVVNDYKEHSIMVKLFSGLSVSLYVNLCNIEIFVSILSSPETNYYIKEGSGMC